ncbi:MAG: S8 family serine peptidase [Clostridiales bacterium]|nr:S8 family serine peptidase [Clostridiales bacterium]
MKRFIFIFLMLFLTSAAVYAAEGDYIVELGENAAVPYSLSLEPVAPSRGIYLVKSMEDVLALGDSVVSYCKDSEASLHSYPDTTNDPYFSYQWNLECIDAAFARKFDIRGEGVTVCIIDSGIMSSHTDFYENSVLPGINAVGEEYTSDVTDNLGHGTGVAGVIAAGINNSTGICGIADKVKIFPVKVTDSKTFSVSSILRGIEAAYTSPQSFDVLNLSLGTADNNTMLEEYIEKIVADGTIVVASVGNDRNSTLNYPAAFESVIGVGSVDKNLSRSSFSNYNSSVFCTAPGGTSIYHPGTVTNSYITRSSGTSFSSPTVAAAAALAKSINPSITQSDFKQLLIDTCTDLGDEGYDTSFGHGLLNIRSMLENELSKQDNISVYEVLKTDTDITFKIRSTLEDTASTILCADYSEDGTLSSAHYRDIVLKNGANSFTFTGGDTLFIWKPDMQPLMSRFEYRIF